MQPKRFILIFLALLVAVGFLAAQLHSCADLTAGPAGSHICPLCSATASAILSPAPVVTTAADAKPLEIFSQVLAVSAELSPSLSPRAPPSL